MSRNQQMTPQDEILFLRAELHRLALQNNELSKIHEVRSSPTTVIQYPARTPAVNPNLRNIFLSGPIHADNWQQLFVEKLEGQPLCILNPRPENVNLFQQSDQLAWELEMLEKSNVAVFWFSWAHPNIVASLTELGRCSATKKYIFVGVDVKNKQKQTIEQFVHAINRNIYVCSTVDKLVSQVTQWIHQGIVQSPSNSSVSVKSESDKSIESPVQQGRKSKNRR